MATRRSSPKKVAVPDQQPLGFEAATPSNDEGELADQPGDEADPAEEGRRELVRIVDHFIDEVGPDTGYARKPVEAILIEPTEGKLTLQARRWYNVMLRNAQLNESETGGRIRMPLKRFFRDARQEKTSNEYLSEVLEILVSTPIRWGDSVKKLHGPAYQWSVAPLLSYASISKKGGANAELIYDFDPEVKAKMLAPGAYAKISLDVQSKMTLYAALFLYELGTRYYKPHMELSSKERPWKEWVVPMVGNRKVNVDKLLYKTFARDTLKPALLEVNDHRLNLPFEIRAETRRVGRKVEGLRFTVSARQGAAKEQGLGTAEGIQLEVEHLTLIGRLISLGVAQAEALKLYEQFGHDRLRQALDNVEKRRSTEPIENMVSYFRKVLKTAKVDPDVVDVESKVVAVSTDKPAVSRGTSINSVLAKKYQEMHRNEVIGLFEESTEAMKEEEYDRFEREGLATYGGPIQREWETFRKKGRGAKLSPLLRMPFFKWFVKDAALPEPDELEAWGRKHGFVTINID